MLNTRTTQVLNTALVAKIVRNWHGCPYSGDKPWWGGGIMEPLQESLGRGVPYKILTPDKNC